MEETKIIETKAAVKISKVDLDFIRRMKLEVGYTSDEKTLSIIIDYLRQNEFPFLAFVKAKVL